MTVELILDLNKPNEKTTIDFSKDKILYLDPRKISFEEFSKDHKPGEYLYIIKDRLYYKCITVSTIPILIYPETIICDYEDPDEKVEEEDPKMVTITYTFEMPKECDKCYFCKDGGYCAPNYCELVRYHSDGEPIDEFPREDECPLKENETIDITKFLRRNKK